MNKAEINVFLNDHGKMAVASEYDGLARIKLVNVAGQRQGTQSLDVGRHTEKRLHGSPSCSSLICK